MRYSQLRFLDVMSYGGNGDRAEMQRKGRSSRRQVEGRVQRGGTGLMGEGLTGDKV